MGKSNTGKFPTFPMDLLGSIAGRGEESGAFKDSGSHSTGAHAEITSNSHFIGNETTTTPGLNLEIQDCFLTIGVSGDMRWRNLPKVRVVDTDERLVYEGIFFNNRISVPLSRTGTYLVSLSDAHQYFMKKITF